MLILLKKSIEKRPIFQYNYNIIWGGGPIGFYLRKGDKMDNFLFWFFFAIVILCCVIAVIAVTQIAQIGFILGKKGDDDEE